MNKETNIADSSSMNGNNFITASNDDLLLKDHTVQVTGTKGELEVGNLGYIDRWETMPDWLDEQPSEEELKEMQLEMEAEEIEQRLKTVEEEAIVKSTKKGAYAELMDRINKRISDESEITESKSPKSPGKKVTWTSGKTKPTFAQVDNTQKSVFDAFMYPKESNAYNNVRIDPVGSVIFEKEEKKKEKEPKYEEKVYRDLDGKIKVKVIEIEEQKINKSEEIYVNYNELANELALTELLAKYGDKYDELESTDEWVELSEKYKKLILKHERNKG